MNQTFRVSLLERIVRSLRTPLGLAWFSILCVLLTLVAVSVFILLISWGTPTRASVASSTVVSPSGRSSAGWADKSAACCQGPQCGDWLLLRKDGLLR